MGALLAGFMDKSPDFIKPTTVLPLGSSPFRTGPTVIAAGATSIPSANLSSLTYNKQQALLKTLYLCLYTKVNVVHVALLYKIIFIERQ